MNAEESLVLAPEFLRYAPPAVWQVWNKLSAERREEIFRVIGYVFTAQVWDNNEYGGIVVNRYGDFFQ